MFPLRCPVVRTCCSAGCVLDVVLVSLMAPRAVLGGKAALLGQSALQKWLGGIPSAALEASVKGEQHQLHHAHGSRGKLPLHGCALT